MERKARYAKHGISHPMNKPKANYGIDAPRVVRNLFLIASGLLLASIFSFQIQNVLWFWIVFLYSFSLFLILFVMGCWMLYGIKISKPKIILQMVQNLDLKGNEKLLDLGCGRGLLLCEAAKYLSHGETYGLDLWSNKDQSGNHQEKTLENADREGVKGRVRIHTGDVRSLPFSDSTFDVVVSSLCLHNIREKKERERALLEMLRVLKPNGQFAIADIQCTKEYAAFLIGQSVQVKYSKPNYSYCPPIRIVKGRKTV